MSLGLLKVWRRNFRVYRKIWKISFLPPMLEPLLYIAAFGVGLAPLIGKVTYRGTDLPYTAFVASGIVALAVMNNAFFENTYASFVRMYYQRTFEAMLATPLTIDEVITGEIVWGATKSVIGAVLMLAVTLPFGLFAYPSSLLIVPVSFLGGLAFGALGMIFTGLVPQIENFNLPVFIVLTPMVLFGGTFFPLDTLPPWAVTAALFSPVTHLVTAVRDLSIGLSPVSILLPLLFLAIFTAICFPLALKTMRKRLIH